MTAVRPEEEVGQASAVTRTEPRLHSHVIDRLPEDHPLATRLVSCERCEAILHLRSNRCVRTWVESGRGNYCLYCFVVAVGALARNHADRLASGDCLPRSFGLELGIENHATKAAGGSGTRLSQA